MDLPSRPDLRNDVPGEGEEDSSEEENGFDLCPASPNSGASGRTDGPQECRPVRKNRNGRIRAFGEPDESLGLAVTVIEILAGGMRGLAIPPGDQTGTDKTDRSSESETKRLDESMRNLSILPDADPRDDVAASKVYGAISSFAELALRSVENERNSVEATLNERSGSADAAFWIRNMMKTTISRDRTVLRTARVLLGTAERKFQNTARRRYLAALRAVGSADCTALKSFLIQPWSPADGSDYTSFARMREQKARRVG